MLLNINTIQSFKGAKNGKLFDSLTLSRVNDNTVNKKSIVLIVLFIKLNYYVNTMHFFAVLLNSMCYISIDNRAVF